MICYGKSLCEISPSIPDEIFSNYKVPQAAYKNFALITLKMKKKDVAQAFTSDLLVMDQL